MSNIVRNGMIGLSALIGVSQIAFYVFDDDYTVTPYRLTVSVFVTLLPIVMGKLMGVADVHKGRKLDQMTEDFRARHQGKNR